MTRKPRKSGTITAVAIAGAFAASLFGAAPGANATIAINTGNNPQPGEETIQFGAQQTGQLFTGTTSPSNIGVQFQSSADLETAGIGQAKLQGPGNTNITGGTAITFTIPGGSFLDLIFNANVTGADTAPGPATISAISNDSSDSQNFDLGNGGNFFTVTASGGERLTSVTLTLGADTVIGSFGEFRVSGAAIPEPASLALLGGALLGFGLIRRRKRS